MNDKWADEARKLSNAQSQEIYVVLKCGNDNGFVSAVTVSEHRGLTGLEEARKAALAFKAKNSDLRVTIAKLLESAVVVENPYEMRPVTVAAPKPKAKPLDSFIQIVPNQPIQPNN